MYPRAACEFPVILLPQPPGSGTRTPVSLEGFGKSLSDGFLFEVGPVVKLAGA